MQIPNHVAIIPDGNRRWARSKGKTAFEGHRRGFERAIEIGKTSRELGIKVLTIWGFSTENWNRDKKEVDNLMVLFAEMTDRFLSDALKNKTRIIHIGRKDRLPKTLQVKILNAEYKTEEFADYYLILALDYGGQDEIVRAVKKIITDKNDPSLINTQLIDSYLDTKNVPYPYPDLVIRTSGEKRLSGYLLWQSAYAELIFIDQFFPDFTPEIFKKSIAEFQQRKRNFGA